MNADSSSAALGQVALELTDNIPVGTYVMQTTKLGVPSFTFASKRFLEMLQLTREEVLADPYRVFRCAHPDEYETVVALNMEVAAKQLPFFWEGRVVVGGEIRWFSIESNPRQSPTGGLIWEGVMIDITRLKQTEQKLQTHEANLDRIVDHTPMPMLYFDAAADGQIQRVNCKFAQLFGYTHAEIPTIERWCELAYPDETYRQEVLARWNHAVDAAPLNDGEVESIDARVTCKDGRMLDVRVGTFKLDGSTVITYVDLTEIKQTQNRLQRILNGAPIALACNGVEQDPKVTYLNERFTRKFGYTMEDFATVGAWSVQAYPDPDYRREIFQRWDEALEKAGLGDGVMEPIEARITCKDGHVKDVLISANILDTMTLVGIVDISERRNAERALEAAILREQSAEQREKINLQQKLKTSLNAAAVAHEINQPLSRILLNSQLGQEMMDRHKEDDRELISILAAITADAGKVTHTIENMRSLLRNVQTDHQQVDLVDIAHSAMLYLKPDLAASKVELLIQGMDRAYPIKGDASQLQIAVVNLLRNSLEALAENPPSGRPQISIGVRCTGPTVELIVGDNGPGFANPQMDSTLFHTTKPSGIGLYVVTTTVENHRGQIILGQSPLGGAEVRLNFPCLCKKMGFKI